MDVEAAVIAAKTRRVRITLLGNPVATVANPLRLAEELAMIDLISGGRVVTGWAREVDSEQFANNTNPAKNRELFEEGVDFIENAWTTPGPFRYEGKKSHFRQVNPGFRRCRNRHRRSGFPALSVPTRPEWMFPPGYNSKAATRRLATLDGPNTSGKPLFTSSCEESDAQIGEIKAKFYAGYPQVLKDMQMIAGTPDNVISKLKKVIDVLRPDIFSFWLDGPVLSKERKRRDTRLVD
jgi:alkanesulfonate monooxygenase SsuD/methylene tetrahydromethanopterin reductase-like flavin-dependent oxidoreductase (luciferase family)